MTLLTCLAVGVLFGVAVYMMLGHDLKGVCMGVFVLGHAANLAILSVSASPLGKAAPVLTGDARIAAMVDPIPQALVLTAIVIGFAVQAVLLTLLVVTWRKTRTLDVGDLGVNEET